jgi:hypothetical protein
MATSEPLKEYRRKRDFRRTPERGHAAFWLEGQKLKGGYALTRIKEGKDEAWLLVKMKDSEADARRKPVTTRPESVLTGRTVEEVARG